MYVLADWKNALIAGLDSEIENMIKLDVLKKY